MRNGVYMCLKYAFPFFFLQNRQLHLHEDFLHSSGLRKLCPADSWQVSVGEYLVLEYYTLILLWFLGSYYNNLYLKSLYFFLGCTPSSGESGAHLGRAGGRLVWCRRHIHAGRWMALNPKPLNPKPLNP